MRRFERNSHNGIAGNFSEKLKDLSPYCFISDMSSDNIELYYRNNNNTYENSYLIRHEFVEALKQNEIREVDILFFDNQCDLKEYFIYFDRNKNIISSLYKNIDWLIIELFEKKLNREFSDAIENNTKNIISELLKLQNRLNEIQTNLNEEDYIIFVKEFFNFLENINKRPLLPISSTFIMYNDDYKDIIDFILENIEITGNNRREKINDNLSKFTNLFEKNSLLVSRRSVFYNVKDIIENYKYQTDFEKIKYIPEKIRIIISYTKLLWENPSTREKGAEKNDFNWTMSIPYIDITKLLIKDSEKYKECISANNEEDKKNIYLNLKRILSKAECYLKVGNYSEFVKECQIFIELNLKAINAYKHPYEEKKYNKIYDKIMNVKKNINHFSNNNLSIQCFLETLCVPFDSENLRNIKSEYIKIDTERNLYNHEDSGTSKYLFKKYLNYLVEEEFGDENQTGLFYKWKEFFEMPDKNIFDQLNEKVLELLKKPDLLNENTYE